MTPESLAKFATEWRNIVRYNLDHGDRRPGRFMTVRYEELLARGRETVCRVLGFLDADARPEVAGELLDRTRFDRLKKKGGSSFFRKGQTGDWKNYFREGDIRLFKEIAGDMLIRTGYETSGEWEG